MTITPEDVAKLREKATQGPWENGDTAVYSSKGFMVADRGMTNIGANMAFLAAAHDMADLIEEQAREIAELRAQVEAADGMEDALILARKDIAGAFEAIAKGASKKSSTLPIIDRWLTAYHEARGQK